MVCGPRMLNRAAAWSFLQLHVPPEHVYVSLERNMHCGFGQCGHCQYGAKFVCKDGPVFALQRDRRHLRQGGDLTWRRHRTPSHDGKPKLAVYKFSSCDGCQLSAAEPGGRAAGPGRGRRGGLLPRGPPPRAAAALRHRPGRGQHLHAGRGGAHPPASAATASSWWPSGPARPPAASRPCATGRTSRSSSAAVYAHPEYIKTLDTATPIAGARLRRFRAARLPGQQGPAAGAALGHAGRAASRSSPRTACASSASGWACPAGW